MLSDTQTSLLAAAVGAGPLAARGGSGMVAVAPSMPPFDPESEKGDIRDKSGAASDDAIATYSGAFNGLAKA